jgi:hypothetical protein
MQALLREVEPEDLTKPKTEALLWWCQLGPNPSDRRWLAASISTVRYAIVSGAIPQSNRGTRQPGEAHEHHRR